MTILASYSTVNPAIEVRVIPDCLAQEILENQFNKHSDGSQDCYLGDDYAYVYGDEHYEWKLFEISDEEIRQYLYEKEERERVWN